MDSPGYVELARSGELRRRIDRALEHLRDCRLCPRECGVDRHAGQLGYCGAGARARVYSHTPHPGEEPPISGARGSGTIFFSHCTLSCRYCQNFRFSQLHEGRECSTDELAAMMIELASLGCHNLNVVTGTQFVPVVLDALGKAARAGVSIPLVWNTSSYESRGTVELLDGVADIYLADLRYYSSEAASAHSDAPDYPTVSRKALLEMQRQVGTLVVDEDGVAERGLIVRHLVLPDDASGTRAALRFVAEALGRSTYVSLMSQYYPAHLAPGDPVLGRRITRAEWEGAVTALDEAGLANGWIQEYPEGLSPIAGTELAPD
ncbi:MAG: radical SAM protein [Candidatus Eisenbacteria bacterium]